MAHRTLQTRSARSVIFFSQPSCCTRAKRDFSTAKEVLQRSLRWFEVPCTFCSTVAAAWHSENALRCCILLSKGVKLAVCPAYNVARRDHGQ